MKSLKMLAVFAALAVFAGCSTAPKTTTSAFDADFLDVAKGKTMTLTLAGANLNGFTITMAADGKTGELKDPTNVVATLTFQKATSALSATYKSSADGSLSTVTVNAGKTGGTVKVGTDTYTFTFN